MPLNTLPPFCWNPVTQVGRAEINNANRANIIAILNTKFKDADCQLIAIKAILGVEDNEEPEPTVPTDPAEPSEP